MKSLKLGNTYNNTTNNNNQKYTINMYLNDKCKYYIMDLEKNESDGKGAKLKDDPLQTGHDLKGYHDDRVIHQ